MVSCALCMQSEVEYILKASYERTSFGQIFACHLETPNGKSRLRVHPKVKKLHRIEILSPAPMMQEQ